MEKRKPVNATTEFVNNTDFASDIPTNGPATVEMVNATKDNFDEDDLVKLLKKMLPADNEMVKKTYQAKKVMKLMGSGYKKIHVCINNCLLYWKDDKDLTACQTCRISRWKVDNKTHKVYENIPAKRITDGVLRHPADSQAWRTIDEKFPDIAEDPRNLRLGILTDEGKGKRTDNKASENQEDTKGRSGKIQKQKRNTIEEEGSSSQVKGQNEKNVAESLVGTLLDVQGKTKDGVNARLDLAELGVKLELFTMQEEDKTTLPPAGYTLTNAEKDIFYETLYNIMVIKGHVRNRNKTEGCITEETITEETIEFFSECHKTMYTIGIPPDKHKTDKNEEGKPLSVGKSSEVYVELFQKAHLYVIQNTYELVPYIERHKQVLKTENPGKRIAFLENEHSKSFAKWLRKEVERELAISKESVSETVRWISYGPRATVVKYDAYNINGYTFRTKCHDGKVYQNSGVSVEAIDLHISKEVATTRQAFYYGVLQEIWVLDYRFRQIPLFKCDWVNHRAGGVKRDNLGYTLVDLNNLGHKVDPFILASQARQVFYVKDQIDKKLSIVFKTPPKNYKDTYDEVDEEFSTVIHQRNDNILPCVNRRDLGNESRDDYYRTDCGACTLHLQLAYAHCICTLHLQLAFASKHLHIAFAG
ncbi:hypothetical protein Tco_0674027 [Tanacetum coccineum]